MAGDRGPQHAIGLARTRGNAVIHEQLNDRKPRQERARSSFRRSDPLEPLEAESADVSRGLDISLVTRNLPQLTCMRVLWRRSVSSRKRVG